MSKSPGHQKWPNHKVLEAPVGQRVTVELDGDIVADSTDAIRVDEDGSPARYYFPRNDVRMEKLQRTSTTSHCPFKGTANYFSLSLDKGDKRGKLDDAVWTYEAPYAAVAAIKDHVAFYPHRVDTIDEHPLALLLGAAGFGFDDAFLAKAYQSIECQGMGDDTKGKS